MVSGSDDKARPSLPPELVQKVRAVQEAYPELCEQNLSAFTATAVRQHIWRVRRQGALEALSRALRDRELHESVAALVLRDED